MRSKIIALAVVLVFGIVAGLLVFRPDPGSSQAKLSPAKAAPTPSPQNARSSRTGVGTGWSGQEDPKAAAAEALTQALNTIGGTEPPNFVMVLDSHAKDFEDVLAEIRRMVGRKPMVYGMKTGSNRGISDLGARLAPAEATTIKRSLSLMAVRSEDIQFGVASSQYENHPSIEEAAAEAVLQAIRSTGRETSERPKAVLITPSMGGEEAALAGIESIVGSNTPILGGTQFRSMTGSYHQDAQIGNGGISLAVIYTKLPLGWVYEAGFEVQTLVSAVITKLDGRRVLELDGRPAIEVYDEWFGGTLLPLCEAGESEAVRRMRNLNPLCKRITTPQNQTYYQYTIAAPNLEHRAIDARIDLVEGDRLYLSQGSWDTLLNRLGQLPTRAKLRAGLDRDSKLLLGFGYFCGGVIDVLPADEIDKIAPLVKRSNNSAPFLAPLTAGEQGFFPGIGNRQGHLSSSFLVIADHQP